MGAIRCDNSRTPEGFEALEDLMLYLSLGSSIKEESRTGEKKRSIIDLIFLCVVVNVLS